MHLRNLIILIILPAWSWLSLPRSGDSIPQIGKAQTQQELSQNNSDGDNEDEERVEAKV